jgi:hypothetical protein
MKKQIAVIVDLDGTLVNVSEIRHFVEGSPRDFDSFHRESVNSPPIPCVRDEIILQKSLGRQIIVLSGRSEKYRALSQFWLAMHEVPYDRLILRDSSDFRSDVVIKSEMYDSLTISYEIVEAVDDRTELISLWRSKGVPVVKQVVNDAFIS